MLDPDRLFFQQLDPFYHFKSASLTWYCQKVNHLRISDGEAEVEVPDEFTGNIEKVKSTSLRFARYHQCETLLTVLFGSDPHGPVVSFSRDPKFRIVEIAKAFSRRELPTRFDIRTKSGALLNFGEWVSYKLFGNRVGLNKENTEELTDFLCREAEFFSDNRAFQAFKHGCMIGGIAPGFQLQKDDGEWVDLIEIDDALAWVNCNLKKGKIEVISVGAEQLTPQNDLSVILIAGMLVNCTRERMLAVLDGRETWNVTVPNSLRIITQFPNKFSIKFKLDA